jgi:hypothetical protein
MYGLVNKALKEFMIRQYGKPMWEALQKTLALPESHFISLESNPDQVTFQILQKMSEMTGAPMDSLAEQLGEFFLEFSGKEGFEDLFDLAGDSLPDMLENLNELHFRVKALMPNLNPPRFEVSDRTEHSLKLHYYSSRDGFTPFLIGTLKALSKRYQLESTLNILPPEKPGEKSIIQISWN